VYVLQRMRPAYRLFNLFLVQLINLHLYHQNGLQFCLQCIHHQILANNRPQFHQPFQPRIHYLTLQVSHRQFHRLFLLHTRLDIQARSLVICRH
jgi:hypothetical protein